MTKRTCPCGEVFADSSRTRPRKWCDGCRKPSRGGNPVQVWACGHCGIECSRPRTRGQMPKWCSQSCADLGKKGGRAVCAQCGTAFYGLGAKFCSPQCNGKSRTVARPASMTPAEMDAYYRSQWSDLRRAIEDADRDLLVRALHGRTERTPDGCWEWSGRFDRSGYPRMKLGRKSILLHRVVLEVMRGKPLGVQHSHHVCANTSCVNPDHLQPATHAENMAEMKARQSYIARIAELEAALAGVAPHHPALQVLPFFEEAS